VVEIRGERVDLTPREFNLLWALADHPGRVMTHESLLDEVWGPAHRPDLDYLCVAVRALGRVRQCGVNSGVASGLHFQAAFGVICSG